MPHCSADNIGLRFLSRNVDAREISLYNPAGCWSQNRQASETNQSPPLSALPISGADAYLPRQQCFFPSQFVSLLILITFHAKCLYNIIIPKRTASGIYNKVGIAKYFRYRCHLFLTIYLIHPALVRIHSLRQHVRYPRS